MKFCSHCGAEIVDDAVICVKCGCSVANTNPQVVGIVNANDAPSSGFSVLGFFFPVIGLLLWIIWNNSSPLKAKSCGKGALFGIIFTIVTAIIMALIGWGSITGALGSSRSNNDFKTEVTAGKVSITDYRGTATKVRIPAKLKGLPVTSIGESAFADCSGLTSITIPKSVISIGKTAFAHCSDLTSVRIPKSVISIGDSAFVDCSGLTSVRIPKSITSIGDWTFAACSGLTSITIPKSVVSIGNGAFYGCSSLTSITIPKSVVSIAYSAFEGCINLTSVTLSRRTEVNRSWLDDQEGAFMNTPAVITYSD
jgi:hypothetical protein